MDSTRIDNDSIGLSVDDGQCVDNQLTPKINRTEFLYGIQPK